MKAYTVRKVQGNYYIKPAVNEQCTYKMASTFKLALKVVSCVVLLNCVLLFGWYFYSPRFIPNIFLFKSVPSSANHSASLFALSDVINNHHKLWQQPPVTTSNTAKLSMSIKKPRGYVLALSYFDQQTSALRSLLSLQCWATKLNLAVVEPFIVGSDFGMQVVEPNNHGDEMEVKFRDLFDIAQWNQNQHSHVKLAPLVSWKNFLENAPRNVILVQIKYTDHPIEFPKLPLDVTCNRTGTTQQFFKSLGFHLQRMVCFDFQKVGVLTTSQFNTYLFGKFSTSNATVVFIEWRGIVTSVFHRIMLRDSVCGSGLGYAKFVLGLNPSQKILKHANQYIQRYLHGRDYVAVVLRLERIYISAGKINIPVCLNKTLGYFSRLKRRIHPANTFLSIDVGRFGSKGYKKHHNIAVDVTQQAEKLIETLYGNSTTIKDYEETFFKISRTSNPGYIALLQKTIAIRAKCLLLVGGGTFQQHASRLYQQMHTSRQCYIQLDGFCSQKVYKVPW